MRLLARIGMGSQGVRRCRAAARGPSSSSLPTIVRAKTEYAEVLIELHREADAAESSNG